MGAVVNFISNYGSSVINVFGIVIFTCILGNFVKLSNHKTRIVGALNRRINRTRINKKTKEMKEEEIEEKITPETIRNYEKDFNKTCSWYQVFSQMVPLFPLLGILGTVSGLIQQVDVQDIEGILGALKTALYTTFWGLIWAIGLKSLVVICPARTIHDVGVMLDDYYNKFNDTIALKNVVDD